uniref:Protein BPS1, chloroplastic n=1 Tax=Anthurium amnicola TaxID=1678845 RepID=A0A1D1XGK9_9ARAE
MGSCSPPSCPASPWSPPCIPPRRNPGWVSRDLLPGGPDLVWWTMASYLSSAVGGWKPLKGTKGAATPPCLHRRAPPPPVSEDDARSFCSSLSEDLRALEGALGEGPVSLRWSADAMRVLKKTQVELLALFRRSQLPAAVGPEMGWFDQYMEETAVLLDLCNHLRSVASGISRYRMVVDLAVQRIQDGSPPELETLESDHREFLGVAQRREPTLPDDAAAPPDRTTRDKSATGTAMLAARCATVAISLMLVSAFVSPVRIDVGEEGTAREFPQLGPLPASLASLVGRFRERGAALAEHQLVRDAVGDVRSRLGKGSADDDEGLSRSVQLLRQRSMGLKEAIEVFDSAVDEVFDETIKGRNALLATYRDEALT